MNSTQKMSEVSRILIPLAAFVIVLAGMKAAVSIVGPILFSIFLTVIFGMLLHWFERKGFTTRNAFILTLAIFFAILAVFIVVIAGSFLQLLSDLPRYQQELEASLELISPYLISVGIDPSSLTLQEIVTSLSIEIGSLIRQLWNIAILFVMIILTTIFLLFEARGFSHKLRIIIEQLRPGDLPRFISLADKNVGYLIIRTEVNLAMGIGTAVILALIGVKYAILWGFIAFLLGFIPYIGFWLAVIPPMLLAWFDIGPVAAILVLAGSGIVNLMAEYLMFPHLAARGLALSTAVVFISLIFWGWLLGGFGVLLAVPLTLSVQMICELFDETRWISLLLGPAPGKDKRP
ncbi:MAG TPA: AI-2E family transporter [Methanoregulaceae archaeon]|nr:AI-2E family transporter [Methanoregulaceae archaeon]HPM61266.1 AI-2E family transporter [Methanoregulaceae archaeon]